MLRDILTGVVSSQLFKKPHKSFALLPVTGLIELFIKKDHFIFYSLFFCLVLVSSFVRKPELLLLLNFI